MSDPKLHHYVPQFYLRRFYDPAGQLWAWDRNHDRVFPTTSRSVAAEQGFYYQDELAAAGHDPLTMERQFSALETETANITSQWIEWIRAADLSMQIPVPPVNREIVALFVTLQFLRTADRRGLLAAFAPGAPDGAITEQERRALHTYALWDEGLIGRLRERVESSIWIFGRNDTPVPFVTSDNPVAFRRGDNAMWMKAGMFSAGAYVVYPLAPDIVLYCHPREEPWLKVTSLDCTVSPVALTEEMVASENCGQVFMASRFVLSPSNDFTWAREFAATIGTDTYAAYWTADPHEPSSDARLD